MPSMNTVLTDVKNLLAAGEYDVSCVFGITYSNFVDYKSLGGDVKVTVFPSSLASERLTRSGANLYELEVFVSVIKKVTGKTEAAIQTELSPLFDLLIEFIMVLQGQNLSDNVTYKTVAIDQFYDYDNLANNRLFSSVIAVHYLYTA